MTKYKIGFIIKKNNRKETEMKTLTNQFQIVGTLTECFVDFNADGICANFGVKTHDQTITVRYWSSKHEIADGFIEMIKQIVPEFEVGKQRSYEVKTPTDTPIKLFCTGNIKSKKDRIFFNGEGLKIINTNSVNYCDDFKITLEGVWVDDNRFLNIIYDSPQVFKIKKPDECKERQVYCCSMALNNGYSVDGDTIKKENGDYDFNVRRLTPNNTQRIMAPYSVKHYLKEWSIMAE